MNTALHALLDSWKSNPDKQIKIMTFGASESHFSYHSKARPNWFHWLEKSFRNHAGVHYVFMNCSVNGNNVHDLWNRFDRDVEPLKPDLVFITMGGNDAKSEVSIDDFITKMTVMCGRIAAWGGTPVLQTLYSPVLHQYDDHFERLPLFMEALRGIAKEQNIPCIDVENLFLPYYQKAPDEYERYLMADEIHVSPVGNAVWACLVCGEFGLPYPDMHDIEEDVLFFISMLKNTVSL